jgi:hypothetical protein
MDDNESKKEEDELNDRERERREQEEIHTAIQESLKLPEGEILTGWIICYETVGLDNERTAGHVYGPAGMTTWAAMGLIEWAKSRSLPGGVDDALAEEEDVD